MIVGSVLSSDNIVIEVLYASDINWQHWMPLKYFSFGRKFLFSLSCNMYSKLLISKPNFLYCCLFFCSCLYIFLITFSLLSSLL
ncbi:hypothetical protein BD408DRAFT_427057 [Parasitella parasitica]|nr:hypothetical protein BD408DRAFT_427057 [Parasitella parasitica]